jgi:RNA polymerase sigma-70 factor (ECF subfamily)
MLQRLGRGAEAATAYDAAIARAGNAAERALLQGRKRSLSGMPRSV